MSSHHHDKCCPSYPMMYGYGGGMEAYGGGYGVGSCGGYGFGIRWIYALLILIVIVLQFGRRNRRCCENNALATCEDGAVATNGLFNNCDNDCQAIDNSVLFIIVVFLLIICAGCFGGGGASGYGVGGYGAY